MKNKKSGNIRTQSVHTGVYKDNTFNSVTTPIYPTSTFYFDEIGKNKGYDYTRSGNPTRTALEQNLAALEGAVGCSATCTGMAAITAVLFFLKTGDHVVAGDDIYGRFTLNRRLKKEAVLKRLFLHAFRLSFYHPTSGRRLEILDPLPDDLESALAKLQRRS